MSPNHSPAAPKGASPLSLDWMALLTALVLAVLVRAGVIGNVPW
jgi:hypothetical protein